MEQYEKELQLRLHCERKNINIVYPLVLIKVHYLTQRQQHNKGKKECGECELMFWSFYIALMVIECSVRYAVNMAKQLNSPFATSKQCCLFLECSESVYGALTSLLLSDVDDDEAPRRSDSECRACNCCSGLGVEL